MTIAMHETDADKDPGEVVAARLTIEGRVQGVAYRWSMQEEATRQGVRGWVRNQSDGTVAAHVEGRRKDVEATLSWCWQGPAVARVTRVDVTWGPPEGGRERFEIRY
jgi:acylphosphatase